MWSLKCHRGSPIVPMKAPLLEVQSATLLKVVIYTHNIASPMVLVRAKNRFGASALALDVKKCLELLLCTWKKK